MGRTDLLPSVWHEVARVADGGGHAVVCGGRGWQTMLERPTSGDGEGGRAQWCANSVCCPGPGAADGCAIRDWEAQQGQAYCVAGERGVRAGSHFTDDARDCCDWAHELG